MTSFHNYLRIKQVPLIREHILAIRKILDRYSKPQTLPGGKKAVKPLLLTEYGFQAEQDIAHYESQAMKMYEYGLWNANTCMSVMNYGVSAATLWVLHSIYYGPTNPMQYGLWGYKDKNGHWPLRPVYYSAGLFTRFARRGMTPIALELSADSCEFNAAALRDDRGAVTLYLVNLADKPVKATLAGFPQGRYRLYEYTRDKVQELSAQSQDKVEALAAGQVQVGESPLLTVKPKSLVVLRKPN